MDHAALLKVVDADISLEAHVGGLARGNVATTAANSDTRNLVSVSSKEASALGVTNLADNDASSKGVQEVSTVGVDVKTTDNVTAKAHSALQLKTGHGLNIQVQRSSH